MMVADLPYAHETVGRYDQVDFIDVQDAPALAGKMLVFQNDRASHSRTQGVEPSPPFACGWRELLSLLVEGLD
jgi:hypothetical protein